MIFFFETSSCTVTWTGLTMSLVEAGFELVITPCQTLEQWVVGYSAWSETSFMCHLQAWDEDHYFMEA